MQHLWSEANLDDKVTRLAIWILFCSCALCNRQPCTSSTTFSAFSSGSMLAYIANLLAQKSFNKNTSSVAHDTNLIWPLKASLHSSETKAPKSLQFQAKNLHISKLPAVFCTKTLVIGTNHFEELHRFRIKKFAIWKNKSLWPRNIPPPKTNSSPLKNDGRQVFPFEMFSFHRTFFNLLVDNTT